MPNRARLALEQWTAQLFLYIPTLVCNTYGGRFRDGFIRCAGCGVRFEARSDLSGLAQSFREKDITA